MLKISLEMIDDENQVVKAEVHESRIDQNCIASDVVAVIPRLLMAAGWFPESIFEALETWVEENRVVYGEPEADKYSDDYGEK